MARLAYGLMKPIVSRFSTAFHIATKLQRAPPMGEGLILMVGLLIQSFNTAFPTKTRGAATAFFNTGERAPGIKMCTVITSAKTMAPFLIHKPAYTSGIVQAMKNNFTIVRSMGILFIIQRLRRSASQKQAKAKAFDSTTTYL